MQLQFSAADQAFRQQVRAFIRDNLPDATRRHMEQLRAPNRDMIVEWIDSRISSQARDIQNFETSRADNGCPIACSANRCASARS